MSDRTVILSAGGTGGHLFPAAALSQAMGPRGWRVVLLTDPRGDRYAEGFPCDEKHVVASATFAGRNPAGLIRSALSLGTGYIHARRLMRRERPCVVVGFGGYPTVPPVLAAAHAGVPAVLHEQNAVMGRANRFLAARVAAVATGFDLRDGTDVGGTPVTVTGNPLRENALRAARTPYREREPHAAFDLVVFGGSQGASFFAEAVPAALSLLDETYRRRIRLSMQARAEDRDAVVARLREAGVEARVEPFFADMPARIAAAHFVVSRAGASTVAELAAIGRPSLLVPFPGALDDDQGRNAARLEAEGAAELVRQSDLSPERLSRAIRDAMDDPTGLARRAQNAKETAIPDAAVRLADLVERVAAS